MDMCEEIVTVQMQFALLCMHAYYVKHKYLALRNVYSKQHNNIVLKTTQ